MSRSITAWRTTVPVGSQKVYVFEREDRGNALFVKFSDPNKSGRDRRVKTRLPGGLTVRDDKGRLHPKLVRAVIHAVASFAAPLLRDESPRPASAAPRPLSLHEGFDLALGLESGKFADKTLRWQEVKRARAKIERILGGGTPWVSITSVDTRRLWRTLAMAYTRAGKDETCAGARQTEVTVDVLYSIAAWLREDNHIPLDAALPSKHWRAKLKKEWTDITGETVRPNRPRHTAAEMRALFARMHDQQVDPRFALAFDLGGEARIGQVIRCKRSALELPPIDAASNTSGTLGTLYIPASGNKTTSPVALHPTQRQAVDRALAGYLSEFECDFRAGRIADYPLFPAGRLAKGKAKSSATAKPLTRAAALDMFHRLEAVAGVVSMKGRGWNGVRRIATDVAEDIETDERVLNSITGHKDSAMRRAVYQHGNRPEILIRAAETRAEMRGILAGSAHAKTPPCVPQSVPQSKTAGINDPQRLSQTSSISVLRLERAMGLEPTTSSLGSWHSTN
jgi:integrase